MPKSVGDLPEDTMNRGDVLEKLAAFAVAHERWEADLILSDEAWDGGMAEFPRLTAELYDSFMQVQALRNEALELALKMGIVPTATQASAPAEPASP